MNRTIRSMLLGIAMAGAISSGVLAHGPTPQKVEESIEVKVEPDAAWTLVKDFANIGSWHPGLAKSAGSAGCAGGTRTLTLKSGGDLVEGADECNDGEKALYYRLSTENVNAFPVSSYSSKIEVKPGASGGTTLTWTARLYRADTTNDPPEDKNDAAAVKAMTDFVTTGLQGLKAKLEAK